MTIPPPKKQHQKEYVQTAVRLPPELHARLKTDADLAGHSLNAEIVACLRQAKSDAVLAELDSIKMTLRKVLDALT